MVGKVGNGGSSLMKKKRALHWKICRKSRIDETKNVNKRTADGKDGKTLEENVVDILTLIDRNGGKNKIAIFSLYN
jgi:hypothetical protein